MTQREKCLFRNALNLLRKTNIQKGQDWKDADDWIFAKLDLTQGDLAEIYKGTKELYYDGSAIEGFAPTALTYDEAKNFLDANCVCEEAETAMGTKDVVVRLQSFKPAVLLTNSEAEVPLESLIGKNVYVSQTPDNHDIVAWALVWSTGSDGSESAEMVVLKTWPAKKK